MITTLTEHNRPFMQRHLEEKQFIHGTLQQRIYIAASLLIHFRWPLSLTGFADHLSGC